MRKTRIFYSDNSVISDLSDTLGDYKTGATTISINSNEDYFYIGNVAPFNHFFIKMGHPVNTEIGSIKVEYWSGTGWTEAIETIDSTSGFAQSGFITFVPDKNSSWIRQDTHEAGGVAGLQSVKIYDYYWARLKFSGDFKEHIQFKWLGQKFSDDLDLADEFPDLTRANVLAAFGQNKADYEAQAVRAAEIIVNEMISNNIIWTKNQILDRDTFKLMSVSKVAELIFTSFGDDYEDQRKLARQEFGSRFKKSIYNVDRDGDGRLSIADQQSRMGYFTR